MCGGAAGRACLYVQAGDGSCCHVSCHACAGHRCRLVIPLLAFPRNAWAVKGAPGVKLGCGFQAPTLTTLSICFAVLLATFAARCGLFSVLGGAAHMRDTGSPSVPVI